MAKRHFGLDAIAPSQFFAPFGRHPRKGEYQLLIAVLQDAVECFQKNALSGDRHFEEAEHWIMGTTEKGTAVLSFEYICSVLDLDPEYLRQGLRRWREAAFVKTDNAHKVHK